MDPKEEKDKALENETTPAQEVIPEETPASEPPKHRYADRLSKAYPDREYKSDADYDTAMEEYLGDLEGFKERGSSMNNKLLALFDAEPQAALVVRDMINGATFREALARHISPEDLTAIEGDPDYEGWTKNKQAREEGMRKRKEFETNYAKNLEESKKTLSEFAEKEGWDETKSEEFINRFDSIVADVNDGKITPEVLQTMKKAFNYDSDIAAVNEKAGIAQKNQEIIGKTTQEQKGDGLPRPTGSGEPPAPTPTGDSYMDNLLDSVKKKQVLGS